MSKFGWIARFTIHQEICGMAGHHLMSQSPVWTVLIRRGGSRRAKIVNRMQVVSTATLLACYPRPYYDESMATAHKTTRQIIRSFEAKAMKKRPLAVRIADRLTSSFGSMSFLLGNVAFFATWIAINQGYFRPAIEPFDPFPYILLTMVVSLEAIMLTVIVLMSQNRQGYISSVRDELILQTNLIAERELTKVLQMISDLVKHGGLKQPPDPELEAMLKTTDISYIERKLEEQLQGPPQKTIPQIVASPIARLGQTVTNAIQATPSPSATIRVGIGKPK